MLKSQHHIRPAKWYFSFFILIVLGFAVQLFLFNRNQAWRAFNYGVSILTDEIWEEIRLFRTTHGYAHSDTVNWTPQLLATFQDQVAQEFIDETIDSQIKAVGLLRITNLISNRILYESPEVKELDFKYIDWIGNQWGYKPFQFYLEDKLYVGMGYHGARINRHYFVGTVFENISMYELTTNAAKYRRICRRVFEAVNRDGLDLYIKNTDELKRYLSNIDAWAYVYFSDNDSLLWSSREIDNNSLFLPKKISIKYYMSHVNDSEGNCYRQFSELSDNNPNFAYKIDIAMPCTYVHRSIFLFGLYISGGALLIIVIAGIGGRSLRRRALQPVNNVIKTVNELSGKSIDKRIPVKDVDDDIARLISTFNHLLDRLAEAFRQQKSFIADTSHELRTPLSILTFDISQALKNIDPKSGVVEHLKEANKEIEHLSRIVNDLQWLAKNDAGQLYIEKENIRLDEVFIDTLSRCQRYATKRNVRLSVREMDIVEFYGDEKLLIHSYSNLVHNAIKYSDEGGEVKLSLIKNNSRVILQVEDEGIGIPAESLGKIFDRFYRVDSSRSRTTGGSGLGLAIAMNIAEYHSGTIRVVSTPGKGSIFSLELPQFNGFISS